MTSEESKAWFRDNYTEKLIPDGRHISTVCVEEQRYQAFKRRLLDEMGSGE